MSNHTFVVYVDESGDEGFRFADGSSDWFVLSAVVTRRVTDVTTVKVVDHVRMRLGKPPKKPLHFRRLKHEQRLPFVGAIAQADLRAVSIIIHKPSLIEREKFREPHRLYFYAVRYLLERVSWYCRDHKGRHDLGDGTAALIFSNRSGMPYEDMKAYLRLLTGRTDLSDVRVDRSVIEPEQLHPYSAGRRMGLQIADAVASSCFYAVQTSRYGFTEPRYVQLLKPVIYHHRGSVMGYGLKFWPREAVSLLDTEATLGWVRQNFR